LPASRLDPVGFSRNVFLAAEKCEFLGLSADGMERQKRQRQTDEKSESTIAP
jgi:hypothetical protein